MKITLAQTRPLKGNIAQNISDTLAYAQVAASERSQLILFPELSLSGYEPSLAESLATHVSDPRLDALQSFSDAHQLLIGVGLPLKGGTGIHISQVFFRPQAPRLVYAKQYLHADERPYFVPGKEQVFIDYQGQKLAPAICYESLLPGHAEKAHQLGAAYYLASVAKPQKGVDKAYAHYPQIAQKYHMPVLMANSVGFCDNFESAGASGVWDGKGKLLGQLSPNKPGILLWDSQSNVLTKKGF